MPTNPFDLDTLDIKVSYAGSSAGAEPQIATISLLSNLCCAVTKYVCFPIITAAFSCVPTAGGCR